MRRFNLVLGLVSVAPFALPAQTTSPIDVCVKAVADSYAVRRQALIDADKAAGISPVVLTPVSTAQTADLKACAARFTVAATAFPDLPALGTLYTRAGLPELAYEVSVKRLTEPKLTENDRAGIMAGAVSSAMGDYTPEKMARAEKLVADLDRLSDAVIVQKLSAHNVLRSRYRYEDVNDKIIAQSKMIIALGKKVKATPPAPPAVAGVKAPAPPPGTVAAGLLLSGYTNIAEVYGDLGFADSAMKILAQARIDHPEISDSAAAPFIDNERERYSLIGKPASILESPQWINAPAGTKSINPKGKVTFIEFSAHWCIPCQHSYPTVTAMAKEFIPQGAQFVLMTEYWGYFAERRPLDEPAEFAADTEYFVHEHDITFPIGVDAHRATVKRGETPPRTNNTNYVVGGIPQTIIVDKNGIIRRILTGWDQGNAERLPPLIKALLAEHAF